jgi:hypothetical protein
MNILTSEYGRPCHEKASSFFSAAAVLLLAGAGSADEKPIYSAPAKPLKAEYTSYAGELGNEQAPTKNDRKGGCPG